ncbi:MAG: hypothetical protein JWQ73_3049 [Variovorax sp.]|jgi:hypothetical protein|nr:hypothetical protein [Variovorax sp.]
MNMFNNEDRFRSAGSAAVAVLDHRSTNAEVSAAPWVFDRGSVSSDGVSRAWAEFSHAALVDGFLRDTLAIIAAQDSAGGWKVSHAITRAKR